MKFKFITLLACMLLVSSCSKKSETAADATLAVLDSGDSVALAVDASAVDVAVDASASDVDVSVDSTKAAD